MFKKLLLVPVALVTTCLANTINHYVSAAKYNDCNAGTRAEAALSSMQTAAAPTLLG